MSRFVDDEVRMQTWRQTELLQMFKVTTTASHAGSRVLGEACHRLVNVFLWQLFPDGLQGDFQLINCLRLWLESMILFRHGITDVTLQQAQMWKF